MDTGIIEDISYWEKQKDQYLKQYARAVPNEKPAQQLIFSKFLPTWEKQKTKQLKKINIKRKL